MRENTSLPNGLQPSAEAGSEVPIDPVHQSIDAIVEMHNRAEGQVHRHQRVVENATAWVGRPIVIQVVLLLLVLWIIFNTIGSFAHLPAPDPPPFSGMQGVVSVSALFVALMVLITENRQARKAERRSQLDLQISLLVEQKVVKLINLVEELRRDMPNVRNRVDPEVELMREPTDPNAIAVALDASLNNSIQRLLEDEVDDA